MMKHHDLFYLLLLLILSCQPEVSGDNEAAIENDRDASVREVAEDYFATFSERENWDKLRSFYAADMIFADVTLQIALDSLWQFERFYDWPDTNFAKLYPDQPHLDIESLLVDDKTAVARGRVNPFNWHGERVDVDWGMEFTIWLYFDDDLKIRRQIDWMEYDPSVLEEVLRHYHENGVDALPGWLDLSPPAGEHN